MQVFDRLGVLDAIVGTGGAVKLDRLTMVINAGGRIEERPRSAVLPPAHAVRFGG